MHLLKHLLSTGTRNIKQGPKHYTQQSQVFYNDVKRIKPTALKECRAGSRESCDAHTDRPTVHTRSSPVPATASSHASSRATLPPLSLPSDFRASPCAISVLQNHTLGKKTRPMAVASLPPKGVVLCKCAWIF